MKKYITEKVCKRYGFEKERIDAGISFLLDCSFWKTEYESIYITDFNFTNDEDLENKDCSMIFLRKPGLVRSQIISNDVLQDEKIFKYVLGEFKKECNNIIKETEL